MKSILQQLLSVKPLDSERFRPRESAENWSPESALKRLRKRGQLPDIFIDAAEAIPNVAERKTAVLALSMLNQFAASKLATTGDIRRWLESGRLPAIEPSDLRSLAQLRVTARRLAGAAKRTETLSIEQREIISKLSSDRSSEKLNRRAERVEERSKVASASLEQLVSEFVHALRRVEDLLGSLKG